MKIKKTEKKEEKLPQRIEDFINTVCPNKIKVEFNKIATYDVLQGFYYIVDVYPSEVYGGYVFNADTCELVGYYNTSLPNFSIGIDIVSLSKFLSSGGKLV